MESTSVIITIYPIRTSMFTFYSIQDAPRVIPVEEDFTSIKPESRYLEVKVPIVTEKFYDENKS